MEARIAATSFKESPAAVILLRAIRANLTEVPATTQQVAELESYLCNDDIVASAEGQNGFGIQLRLREPLLGALAEVRAAMAQGTETLK